MIRQDDERDGSSALLGSLVTKTGFVPQAWDSIKRVQLITAVVVAHFNDAGDSVGEG